VKAGLLPRLAKAVTAVYVEATTDDTEARVLKGLRRQVQDMPGDLGLIAALAALRRGRYLESGQKVLLVLDQFEQWLHARRNEENTELVQALRHCDGGRLQCVVMVRDDFWMATTRFMSALEIELLQGKNLAPVDLFDPRHAKKVLAAFGRAFGTLPERAGDLPRDEEAFLDQAVAGLAQDGKVISVRLALFAEMVKGKPWTPATLKEVGGMEGVGVTFLEETFAASTAPPQHRLHQKAAQAVLRALLPEQGTDIKGNMRSHADLLEASSYASRLKDFASLLRILDGELRLLTPTDPEGVASENAASTKAVAGAKYYQLTHDYLVHSLRDWLTRKQKESRRGRAELLLADRAAVWNARPENRQLPSLRQWLSIRWLTAKKKWTPPQRSMMGKAGTYHALRAGVLFALLAVIGWGGWEVHGSLRASGLVQQVLDADVEKVPDIVREMERYRRWAEPRLRTSYAEAESAGNADRQLRASLALLPADDGQKQYLRGRLLVAAPQEVLVLRQELAAGKDDWLASLWQVVERPEKQPQRLRAACALALYDPENPQWGKASGEVVAQLVVENPVYLEPWLKGFRPVGPALRPALIAVYLDKREDRAAERGLATNILADYAADDANVLGDLILDAEAKQFVVLAPRLQPHREALMARMEEELKKKLAADVAEEKQVALARRQARAGEALLYLGRVDVVWPLLKHRPDPTVRSYLVNGFADHGVEAATLVRRLQVPDVEVSERRGLLLALGAYAPERVPDGVREPLLQKLLDDYEHHPDAGVHGSTEWLLRQWGRLADVRAIEERQRGKPADRRQWYVNGQGQTYTIVREGEPFWMGSPESEANRRPDEKRHLRKIPRSFAIAAKAVTRGQFERFLEANPAIKKEFDANGQAAPLLKQYSPEADTPIVLVNWYLAAQYCNWLSKEEGIEEAQWCYPSDPKKITVGMVLAPEFLEKTGYRLPTEAEWECACRAGAETSRSHGGGDELLGAYAWYLKTSPDRSQVVGRLRPNDWGLFDVQGNVWQWCHDAYRHPYPTKAEGATGDTMDMKDTLSNNYRVLRGGSFNNQASSVRSASVPTVHRRSGTSTAVFVRRGPCLAGIRQVTPAECARVQSPGGRPVSGHRQAVRPHEVQARQVW
jgi:eukaryotic-like serine/threonine-protein kinase